MANPSALTEVFHPPAINLSVDAGGWGDEQIWQALSEKAISAACAILEESFQHHEISLMLADDTVLQELNRNWRGKNKPTNVLSFESALPPGLVASEANILPLGDIAMAYETLMREATLDHKPFDDHFSHLVVHGFLHLLGYDHEEAIMAEEMEDLERIILASLSIPDPYGDTAPV